MKLKWILAEKLYSYYCPVKYEEATIKLVIGYKIYSSIFTKSVKSKRK